MIPDVAKPLVLSRVQLLARLTANRDAEVAKREQAEADVKKRRQEVIDVIKQFTDDELYTIFSNYYTINRETLKEVKAAKTWVPIEAQPTKQETDLDKFILALGMSGEETVEVMPTESLFKLL